MCMCEVASVCHAAFAECHIFSSSKSWRCSVTICTNRGQTVLLSRLGPGSSTPWHLWEALLSLQRRIVLIPNIKPAN